MKKVAGTVLFLAAVAGVVLYASGVFSSGRVEPGRAPEPPGVAPPAATARAERVDVPMAEHAVGTIRSRTRVQIAAQVTARVVEVKADAGETVKAGAPLIVLDDRELTARVEQAQQALTAAEAALERARQSKVAQEAVLAQATASLDRIKRLIEREAATAEEMDKVESVYLAAKARVADSGAAIAAAEAQIQRARKVVAEAEVSLGYARIAAPIDGVVAEREVDPGGLAWPGRILLVVLDPRSLRLEAQVREGLIGRVRPGETLRVELPAAGETVEGRVAEILPSADPLSRTFRVRVNIPAVAGVYPGMFGRLRIGAGERDVIRIPQSAIVRVGQLETVAVKEGARWSRRYVTTGATLPGGMIEVLSGLQGGEEVGTAPANR